MQTIWKGSVSFGLVSIPVKVYAATEERSVTFRQVHVSDGGRVRYRRVCEVDGEEVPYADIARGYELPDGRVVVLTGEDFADLPLPSKHVVDVLEFVSADQIDPIYVAKSYYLEADGGGAKPYVLLRDALVRTGQIALVKVALRNRETLAMLRPKGDVLLLQTMLWPDEVRDEKLVAPDADVEVRSQEVAMAESYIQTLATDFEPDRYSDEYRAALEQLVEAKSEGRAVEVPAEEDRGGGVIDLMAALQASVDDAKRRRGKDGGSSVGSSGGAAKSAAKGVKKATKGTNGARKAASKKQSAAKQSAARKAPARKRA